jgi:metal transporter CNNM
MICHLVWYLQYLESKSLTNPNAKKVDDLRCSVSTDMPPRKYYFPVAIQISVVAALLVLSGLFSGLNLGLMSLTPQELTLISNSGFYFSISPHLLIKF